MENFNEELLEKAKQAKSAEEILVLAKENGMEVTREQAAAYYAQLNPVSGELSDDELDNVAGGGCGGSNTDYLDDLYGGECVYCPKHKCSKCGSQYGIYNCLLVPYAGSAVKLCMVDCETCGTRIVSEYNLTSNEIQKA